MSAEFLKLYRELRHINPNTKALDATFEKEREQVLRTLGYDVGQDNTLVTGSKHHGKAARRFGKQKRLQALNRDNTIEARKMKELQMIRGKVKDITSIAKKIRECSLDGGQIPGVLWEKSSSLYNDPDSSSTSTIHVNTTTGSIKSLKESSFHSSRKLSPKRVSSVPTVRREAQLVRKDYTGNKWSEEERARLNVLYHTLNRPKDHDHMAWEAFYDELSRRFCAFFPTRRSADVREKAALMMRLRQMKEPGEVRYWQQFGASGT